MKITISKAGSLLLERFPGMGVKATICPHNHQTNCGDWCALFRVTYQGEYLGVSLCNQIHICKYENFEDQREQPK